MTQQMVEVVARAIKRKVPVGYGMTDAEALDYARAAIEAMRVPTKAMRQAGANVHLLHENRQTFRPDIAEQMHRAMIDAALNGETP